MLLADAVVGAEHPAPEVREDAVDPGKTTCAAIEPTTFALCLWPLRLRYDASLIAITPRSTTRSTKLVKLAG